MQILVWLGKRLKEPSTWASIAAGVVYLYHADPALFGAVAPYAAAAATGLGIVIPEQGS